MRGLHMSICVPSNAAHLLARSGPIHGRRGEALRKRLAPHRQVRAGCGRYGHKIVDYVSEKQAQRAEVLVWAPPRHRNVLHRVVHVQQRHIGAIAEHTHNNNTPTIAMRQYNGAE